VSEEETPGVPTSKLRRLILKRSVTHPTTTVPSALNITNSSLPTWTTPGP
jgi:hypothetical protein